MLRHILRFSAFPLLPFKVGRYFASNILPATILRCNNDQYGRISRPYLLLSAKLFSTSESINSSLGKLITTHVYSIRFDKVVRKGLNISQLEFEKAFYDQSFRLNKEVLLKKSQRLKESDILDLVTGEDDGKIFGKRIVLDTIEEKSKGFTVTLRCYRRIHQLNIDCEEL